MTLDNTDSGSLVSSPAAVTIDSAITASPLEVTRTRPLDDVVPLGAAHGARVVFSGCVRNHDEDKAVDRLRYEAHPSAEQFFTEAIAAGVSGLDVGAVWARHRIGDLVVGDVALLVVVDAAHRGDAFTACARIVDEVKSRVPIWKDQYFSDGTHSWSNCP